jgi:multifunctional methyltransferase subunit TRM112
MGVYKFDFENLTNEKLYDPDVIQYLHHILFEVIILDGQMVCNNCGKEYDIKDGVPNMVLNDDEV